MVFLFLCIGINCYKHLSFHCSYLLFQKYFFRGGGKMLIIIPIILYLLTMLGIAYKVNQIKNSKEVDFSEEYFIGSRNMGGFV